MCQETLTFRTLKIVSNNSKNLLTPLFNLLTHSIQRVPKDKLINNSSGEMASDLVERILLNTKQNDHCQHKMFIAEYKADIK